MSSGDVDIRPPSIGVHDDRIEGHVMDVHGIQRRVNFGTSFLSHPTMSVDPRLPMIFFSLEVTFVCSRTLLPESCM